MCKQMFWLEYSEKDEKNYTEYVWNWTIQDSLEELAKFAARRTQEFRGNISNIYKIEDLTEEEYNKYHELKEKAEREYKMKKEEEYRQRKEKEKQLKELEKAKKEKNRYNQYLRLKKEFENKENNNV